MTPKRALRVALAQLDYRVGDLDGNFAKIAAATERARGLGADLVVFSELALLGYPPRDLLHRRGLVDAQLDLLERVAALTDEALGLVVGFVDRNPAATGKRLYNAAALCHGGRVVGTSHKCLLPTYDVFDEDRYFERATAVHTHEFMGLRLGLSICEDAWNSPNSQEMPSYPFDPIRAQVEAGADVLINCSASPFSLNKGDFRHDLIGAHARAHRRPFVFVNQIGGNDELVFDGRSMVFGPDGTLLARLHEFEEDLAVVELPVGAADAPQTDDPQTDAPQTAPSQPDPGLLRPTAGSDAAQAHRALVLGLRDYVHKSGFRGAILGLSGGVDSALVATLAAEALGPENVLCVAMPSRYSSEHSLTDARRLAHNLGVELAESSIEPQFQAFLTQLEPFFEGLAPDVTEENLQARARGMLLMALSNKFNRLVLVGSNKSELAVGYSTLYGDMCGALMVLGDCPKLLVYAICHHINEQAGYDLIPEHILTKVPSAELRPDQTDQDTLPPYETLDAILSDYIDLNLEPDEIVARGHDEATVRRTIAMLHRAEYKRCQAPPVLKITAKAFGTGWRYPLAASYRWF